ncbi:MAG TPA: SGNH/GDSL hydrolase family protein [Thermoanaerobaculia bacterium]|nr:SGNH/GDSL hydrolase family protein [Thermoanaerobaculia bacterium]
MRTLVRTPVRTLMRTPVRTLMRTLVRTAIVLAITCGLLALAEGATRLVLRWRTGAWPHTAASRVRAQQDEALRLYRRHPFLNAAPREGTRVHAFGKQAGWNALGYRSPERPLARPAGVLRVLCAGGSTTFDLLAASDDRTWPWRLEETLRRRRPRLEVWNAGFPGWTSLESLISLALRDVDLGPGLVIVYQGDNDLQPGGYQPFDRQYEHGHAELELRALGFDRPPLPWRSRSVLIERLAAAWARPGDPWASLDPSQRRQPHLAPAAIATFARNLRSQVAVARAHGARLALVTQTIRIRNRQRADDLKYLAQWLPGLVPEAVPAELEKLNEVQRAMRGEGGVQVVDAAARIGWQDEDFADPLHFSDRGSERFAEFLSTELLLPAGPLK